MTDITVPVCEHCGEPLRGKRKHARYCDSTCRADATRLRQELEGGKKALKSAAVHPLADARAVQEASELKSHWSQVIYQGIVDRLKQGPVHADDLEPLFPANEQERVMCRKLVGAQFGSLASRHYIAEKERRKSSVPSRKGAKSGVFEFTQRGREKLAGHRAGGRGEPSLSRSGAANATPSSVSGETPAGVSSEQSVNSSPADSSPSLAAHPGGQGSPVACRQQTHGAGESRPTPLPGLEEEKPKPLSAFRDAEAA